MPPGNGCVGPFPLAPSNFSMSARTIRSRPFPLAQLCYPRFGPQLVFWMLHQQRTLPGTFSTWLGLGLTCVSIPLFGPWARSRSCSTQSAITRHALFNGNAGTLLAGCQGLVCGPSSGGRGRWERGWRLCQIWLHVRSGASLTLSMLLGAAAGAGPSMKVIWLLCTMLPGLTPRHHGCMFAKGWRTGQLW